LAVIVVVGVQTVSAQRQQNYTGSGGKGTSLTIYVPQTTGLAKDQNYIPALVHGEIVNNFSNYSAISILDWERLDDIYVKLVSEKYDNNAEAKQDAMLGRLVPTTHFLTGNITKTATGYNIKMNITATADKVAAVSYSGTFTFAELDNLTGIRRVSLELLTKMGVELTEKARQELTGVVETNQILAQTALAKGVTAQRQGMEVAALSYYYQATGFNPALKEAIKRSSKIAASISTGNIGADVRNNDAQWRNNWVAKLKETEEVFYKMIMTEIAAPLYTLTYLTDIQAININHQTGTTDLGITIGLSADRTWFDVMGQALESVRVILDGLNATNKKSVWGLAKWPMAGVSAANPFDSASKKTYDIVVLFELVNQSGRVVGNRTVKLNPAFCIERENNGRFVIVSTGDNIDSVVTVKDVKANDTGDKLTIRVAAINGLPPQKTRFTKNAVQVVEKLNDPRNGKRYNIVRIGGKMWMAENLNYQTGHSWCYENDEFNCKKYGRLYDWNTAARACPSGWRLPSNQDWDILVKTAGGKKAAGKKLKAKNGWNNYGNGTDDYDFSAIPGGYYWNNNIGSFSVDGDIGYWWTATRYGSVTAYNIDISYDGDLVNEVCNDERNGLSVRCIKD
jgi:uncharacterized protein (TIGR02145 family)